MTFDLQNENSAAGSALRNEAANFLAELYGSQIARTEQRVFGKKADGYFVETRLGKESRIYLEAKDYSEPLNRSQVVAIWNDYSGIIEQTQPSDLLLITRHGLSPDAQEYVQNERARMRHLTIWELENEVLGLTNYVRHLQTLFDQEGLSSFYVPARARSVTYGEDHSPMVAETAEPLFERVLSWMQTSDVRPLAVLGGYGAGKTSFTARLLSHQAGTALSDPLARRPILIRLGMISRYNSLDGLLGSMFTSEHKIQGYSFHRFMEFNRRGRLLIVLDGFDEMKHAMSWVDFRNQAEELNKLAADRGKVILLGRPSAFTSDAEHYWILRGKKEYDGAYRNLPGWPEFQEFKLEGFTPSERADFVQRFLAHHEKAAASKQGLSPDAGWVTTRTQEVNRLADLDPEIFSRPVHAKILTELAADPSVDLSKFENNITRWTLYNEFFRSLAVRECSKPARSPIGEESRLQFLRELAFWLWTKKGGSTSFYAPDLPASLFKELPDGDTESADDKAREYLAGAFLERKSGGTYYFPHRSFAEFLVAQRMYMRPPEAGDHSEYGRVVREGVAEFLGDVPDRGVVEGWVDSLAYAAGQIDFEYLQFLAKYIGHENLSARLPTDSVWKLPTQLLQPLQLWESAQLLRLRNAILAADHISAAMIVNWVVPMGPLGPPDRTRNNAISEAVAAALLERLFNAVREAPGATRFSVDDGPDAKLKDLIVAAIPGIATDRNGRRIRFAWEDLGKRATQILKNAGVSVRWTYAPDIRKPTQEEQLLNVSTVLNRMTPAMQREADDYLRPVRGALQVFAVSTGPVNATQPQRRPRPQGSRR